MLSDSDALPLALPLCRLLRLPSLLPPYLPLVILLQLGNISIKVEPSSEPAPDRLWRQHARLKRVTSVEGLVLVVRVLEWVKSED